MTYEINLKQAQDLVLRLKDGMKTELDATLGDVRKEMERDDNFKSIMKEALNGSAGSRTGDPRMLLEDSKSLLQEIQYTLQGSANQMASTRNTRHETIGRLSTFTANQLT